MHSPKGRRLRSAPAAVSKRRAPACAGAASLPDELIFDVLSWLPVKSVCRFRCVSRGWRALVADPSFIAAHRSRHADPLLVFAFSHGNPNADLQLMDLDGNVVVTTKGVFGTVLASTSTDDHVLLTDTKSGGVRVIDPATGKVLQDCPKKMVYDDDGTLVDIIHGFGRAVPSGAYKVLRLMSDIPYRCKILTIGGGDTRWRRSMSPLIFIGWKRISLSSSVSLDGVVYFLASWQKNRHSLLCFDIENEAWTREIQGPPAQWTRTELARRITELNGAVCMLVSELEMPKKNHYGRAIIWVLTDSDESTWIKAYTIPMAPYTYEYLPLRVTPDGGGKLIFYCLSREHGDVLHVYNPRTETCTTMRRLDYIVKKIGLCSLHLDRFVMPKN